MTWPSSLTPACRSSANLDAIDEAGLRFIVDSQQTKAPTVLAAHFHWNGEYTEVGHTVDTLTPRGKKSLDPSRIYRRTEPVWTPGKYPDASRAVSQYRRKRALRDERTLNQQRNRTLKVVEGLRTQTNDRFVTIQGATKTFDESSYDRALRLSGWKGYVSNIEADIMPALEVVGS